MGTLIIYHDNAPDREIELGQNTMSVGRTEDSDICLPDPTKGISRHHAELRFEQGQYSLVDMNSQNGVWVAGKRVTSTTLQPGVPVVLGSYKLLLKSPEPEMPVAEPTVLFQAPVMPAEAKTIVVPRAKLGLPDAKPTATPVAPKAPVPAPVVVEPPKAAPPAPRSPEPEPPAPTPASPPAAAPPTAAAAPAAPAPAPAPAPAAAPKPPEEAKPVPRAARKFPRAVVLGSVAAVVVLGAAVTAFQWISHRRSNATSASTEAPRPEGASPTAVPPSSVPPSAVGVPRSPAAATPATTAAAASADAKAPASSAPPLAAPPAAPVPAPPAASRASTARPHRPAPAAAAGESVAAPKPAKTASPPKAVAPAAPVKPINLAARFEEARSAMIRGDYLAAIAGFQTILDVKADYPNAANLMNVARGGAKNAAQLEVDTGNKAEMSGDYDGAEKRYKHAIQLDPTSTEAADALRRLYLRKQREGEDALRRARSAAASGNKADAIAAYERALKLLSDDHPDVKAARDQLSALKGS